MLLGGDALGRAVLGQISSTSTIDLTAAAGIFALTGQPVTFKTLEVAAGGTFVLTGQAVIFDPQEAAASGSFALTGEAVTFKVKFPVAQGTYALSGQATIGAVSMPVACGLFTLTGEPVDFNDLRSGGGARRTKPRPTPRRTIEPPKPLELPPIAPKPLPKGLRPEDFRDVRDIGTPDAQRVEAQINDAHDLQDALAALAAFDDPAAEAVKRVLLDQMDAQDVQDALAAIAALETI